MPLNAKTPLPIRTGVSIPLRKDQVAEDQAVQRITHSQQEVEEKQPREQKISWTWRGAEFARVMPGPHQAICTSFKGPEFVKAYGRYCLRLNYELLGEEISVAQFFNFGRKARPDPPGPLSKYFAAWCLVNGDLPLRGQSMSPRIFVEPALIYTLRIEDANIDYRKQDKPPCLVYSRVAEIISVVRP